MIKAAIAQGGKGWVLDVGAGAGVEVEIEVSDEDAVEIESEVELVEFDVVIEEEFVSWEEGAGPLLR